MPKINHSPHIEHVAKHVNKTYKFLQKLRLRKSNINTIITAIAIVMIRRGVWGFLDIMLFPNNKILSLASSIILGIIILRLDNRELDPKFKFENRHFESIIS